MTGIETFADNTDSVLDAWDREDLAQNIYAAAAGRVAMSLNANNVHEDKGLLTALAAYAKFAAAVYFDEVGDAEQKA